MIYKIDCPTILNPIDPEKYSGRSGVFPIRRTRHVHNIPGTKLLKKFIKNERNELNGYREILADYKQYVDVR